MSDPVLDLQAALLVYLRRQASLAVWLGTPARIYDQPPAEVLYPYVTFGRVSAQSIGGVGAEVTEQVLNLMCVSRFDGSEEAKAMAAEPGPEQRQAVLQISRELTRMRQTGHDMSEKYKETSTGGLAVNVVEC